MPEMCRVEWTRQIYQQFVGGNFEANTIHVNMYLVNSPIAGA